LSAKAEVTAVALNDQIHEKVDVPVELKEALRRVFEHSE